MAAPTTPGQYEAIEAGLVNTLRDNGVDVAVFDTLECEGRVEGLDDGVCIYPIDDYRAAPS